MSQDLRRKLKAAREKLKMSQSQFAAALGLSVRTLQGWERNQSTPDAFKLKVLEEKIDFLLAEQ